MCVLFGVLGCCCLVDGYVLGTLFSGGLLRLRVGIAGGGFGISFLGFGGYASSLFVYIVCWYGFWVAALGVVVVGVVGW